VFLTSESRLKSVFFFDELSIDRLKGCVLFWKTIVVYEGFIQSLSQYQGFTESVKELFEAGILKIISNPDEFQKGLYDKIYYGIDGSLLKYLANNADTVTVTPALPDDAEEIIQESTASDNKNHELKQLYDSIIYQGKLNEWLIGTDESQYYSQMPSTIKTELLEKIKTVVTEEIANYKTRGGDIFYNFKHRNKMLLEQFSVSSAICIDSKWIPFYRYKLGDFNVKHADIYLSGLNVVVPLMTNIHLHDLTFEEILRLRKNKSWNNAMNQFGNLCYAAKTSNSGDFTEKIRDKVLLNCLDAYKEESITVRKLVKDETKNALYTGISMIPCVGPAISGFTGMADPIINYLSTRNKQKNLPPFLNDMRNIRPK
jgi:hypothetical protein